MQDYLHELKEIYNLHLAALWGFASSGVVRRVNFKPLNMQE